MSERDWCQFFADIEADPHKLVTDLTIRDYLRARSHVQTCKKCSESAERTLAKQDKDDGYIEFSGN